MSSTFHVHPKGDCKSPLLVLPPVSELFEQGQAKDKRNQNSGKETTDYTDYTD
jgi:hypothetical protein